MKTKVTDVARQSNVHKPELWTYNLGIRVYLNNKINEIRMGLQEILVTQNFVTDIELWDDSVKSNVPFLWLS